MTKLKAARLGKKMTQVHLSFRSGVAPTDISKAENGMTRLYPTQAKRIARVLGLSASELLESVDEPQHAA
jgi:transcriptional regulator with XRE-family HTH domain